MITTVRRGPVPVRFPWEPIERLRHGTPISRLARTAGVPPHSIYRWKREGLTINGADLIAAALGHHPVQIWGNEFFQAGTSCHRGHPWEGNERWRGNGLRCCGLCETLNHNARKAA